ncbi:MAG: hypothetical protein IT233_11250 [Bacteroidia bacterium]|nr:hypothetical protein [Bacteroidia bacterium]
MSNSVLLAHTKLTLRADGVVEIVCGDEVHYKRTHVEELNSGLEQLLGNSKACLLVLVGKHTSISKDGREYSATPEATRFSIAEAYVLQNMAQRIVGNFYIRMDKPPVPTRMFSHTNEAEKWFKKFYGTTGAGPEEL